MKWYKRDPDAFIFGTIGLTLEEVGAYALLLDAMYSRNNRLPNDIVFIKQLLRCNRRVAERLVMKLITFGKIEEIGTNLINPRAKLDINRYLLFQKDKQNQRNSPVESRIQNKERKKERKESAGSLATAPRDGALREPARAAPNGAAKKKAANNRKVPGYDVQWAHILKQSKAFV